MVKTGGFMRFSLLLLVLFFSTSLLAGTDKKRDREDNLSIESPLGTGTHLCRVDKPFHVLKSGVLKSRKPDLRLQTAYLPCDVENLAYMGNKQQVLVQILPKEEYDRPYNMPIVLSHENVIAVAKFRSVRAMQIGMSVFARWDHEPNEKAPKLWGAKIQSFDIAQKRATVEWEFVGEGQKPTSNLPFTQIFHVPRE